MNIYIVKTTDMKPVEIDAENFSSAGEGKLIYFYVEGEVVAGFPCDKVIGVIKKGSLSKDSN
jgi:hypothetical protein